MCIFTLNKVLIPGKITITPNIIRNPNRNKEGEIKMETYVDKINTQSDTVKFLYNSIIYCMCNIFLDGYNIILL